MDDEPLIDLVNERSKKVGIERATPSRLTTSGIVEEEIGEAWHWD